MPWTCIRVDACQRPCAAAGFFISRKTRYGADIQAVAAAWLRIGAQRVVAKDQGIAAIGGDRAAGADNVATGRGADFKGQGVVAAGEVDGVGLCASIAGEAPCNVATAGDRGTAHAEDADPATGNAVAAADAGAVGVGQREPTAPDSGPGGTGRAMDSWHAAAARAVAAALPARTPGAAVSSLDAAKVGKAEPGGRGIDACRTAAAIPPAAALAVAVAAGSTGSAVSTSATGDMAVVGKAERAASVHAAINSAAGFPACSP